MNPGESLRSLMTRLSAAAGAKQDCADLISATSQLVSADVSGGSYP